MAVFIALSLLAGIVFVIYIATTWNYNFWKKRNVPHLKPIPIFGNYKDFIVAKKTNYEIADEICKQFPEEPYIGTFYGTEPALLVKDPELIKLILAQDAGYFSGREVSKYCDREPQTKNLFSTYGDKWKVIRQNTSPLFTASKLKKMFPIVQRSAREFEKMLAKEYRKSNVFDARATTARFTMDVISSIGFGVDLNLMESENVENNAFKKIGDGIFNTSMAQHLRNITRAIWPALFYATGHRVFLEHLTEFFNSFITNVFKDRDYKPSSRNDFVDMVLSLKEQEYLTCESVFKSKQGQLATMKVDEELLVSLVLMFFAAGYETSSTTMSFTLYQLAKDRMAQERARVEIDDYLSKRDGKIEFDCLTELPFLEACVNETLRFFPVLGLLTREVLEPYVMPSGLKLDIGLRVHLPVTHLHQNPDYFPDPETFKPERFLPENKSNIKPYTYMPFGEGQRICVGMRVARMQMYPGLITVLRKYRVELAEGTPEKLAYEPKSIITQASHQIKLKFIPRDQ